MVLFFQAPKTNVETNDLKNIHNVTLKTIKAMT